MLLMQELKKVEKNAIKPAVKFNYRTSWRTYKIRKDISKENFMKKIILGLFLILGAISFAAPKFVDMAKVKNAGYVIKNEREDILTMTTSDDDSAIIISFSTANISSKEISDLLKSNALHNSENFYSYTW